MNFLISYKVYENVNKVKSLMKSDSDFKVSKGFVENLIKEIPSGYLGKIIELMNDKISEIDFSHWETLSLQKKVYEILKELKNKSIKLTKQVDQYNDLYEIFDDIEISKIEKKVNRIKKINNIKFKTDRNFSEKLYRYGIRVDDIPLNLGGLRSVKNEDILFDIIKRGNSLHSKHKDWDVIYEDDTYLIYEILSHEGALHCIGNHHCIQSDVVYRNYKEKGNRFFNVVNKDNIKSSIFFDIEPWDKKYYMVIRDWDQNSIIDPLSKENVNDIKNGHKIDVNYKSGKDKYSNLINLILKVIPTINF